MLVLEPHPGQATALEPPRIIAPPASLFARRARRLEQLADGHALGDWLRFVALLCQAQDAAVASLAVVPLPTPDQLAASRQFGMPPMPAQFWQRAPAWREVLMQLADRVAGAAPEASQRSLRLLRRLDGERLEALADQVLATRPSGPDAALLPFVGAALEAYWTALAMRVDGSLAPLELDGICPACGFLPVASVVRADRGVANLRYLHCALCNTEWNRVRITCTACGSTAGISYRHIEGADLRSAPAVRAETCEECKSYLKILYQEKAPDADPVADDLATLALDMLVDEDGYRRAGPNLLFFSGSE